MVYTRAINLVICVLSYFQFCGNCFNVDTYFPIIYTSNETSQRPTYFGFSLLLYEMEGNESWIQIGAPRSNSTYPHFASVKEPGVVYRCPISGPCKEMLLDRVGNGIPKGRKCTEDLKDFAWIGGAMAAEQTPHGRVAICGHRWRNKYHSISKQEYYINGMCYWLYADDKDINASRLIPTVPEECGCPKGTFYLLGKEKQPFYYYGVSQVGMSVTFVPENEKFSRNSRLLLGSPGLVNWIGGLVQYESTSNKDKGFNDPDIVNSYNMYYNGITNFDLFGYQVATGKFFNKSQNIFAASSPRGQLFQGYVILLDYPKGPLQEDSKWRKIDILMGEEMGECFGYSLTVGDITGDGFDDLVVGAPLFSDNGQKRDTGRIYVFLGNNKNKMQPPKIGRTIHGVQVDGRFGSAVMCLTDINRDGYADIAVGAPYEDNYRGAIYIYNGGQHGLKVPHSQYIQAAQIDEGLRGFGVSIAPPADIDGNKYTDVAVGAFLSGHAVLLRTYPIVTLRLWIVPSVTKIFMNTTAIEIKACQSYIGTYAPQTIETRRIILVDESGRSKLNISEAKVIPLRNNELMCESVTILHKHDPKNWNDLQVRMFHELKQPRTNKTPTWIDDRSAHSGPLPFCQNCVIVDKASSILDTAFNFPYIRECKGKVCNSNLKLTCAILREKNRESLNGSYTMGSFDNTILYVMTVTNTEETAYSTYVNFTMPENVNIVHLSQDCQEFYDKNNQLYIICDFRTPIRKGDPVNMELLLDTSSLTELVNETTGMVPDLIFTSSVHSTSQETHEADNYCVTRLSVEIDADLKIMGQSEQPIYTYDKKEKPNGMNDVNFIQMYQVKKIGISPVMRVVVQLKLPAVWYSPEGERLQVLKVNEPKLKNSKEHILCRSDDMKFFYTKREIESHTSQISNSNSRRKRSVTDKKTNSTKLKMKERTYDFPANRSLYLICSDKQVQCQTIECTIEMFSYDSIDLGLEIFLDVAKLEHFMGKKDIIYVTTEGIVQLEKNVTYPDIGKENFVAVSSIFKRNELIPKVELWIYILSIAAGILVILLLVMGLVKAGFFQRKKKEELKALMDANNEFDVTLHNEMKKEQNISEYDVNDGGEDIFPTQNMSVQEK